MAPHKVRLCAAPSTLDICGNRSKIASWVFEGSVADPSPYVYSGGGVAVVIAWLSANSQHLAREVPHLLHIAGHVWGGILGFIVGYAAGNTFGWGWILGSVGFALGLFLQHQNSE